MDILAAQLMNGLIVGCIYGLMALGLTLIFGVLRIINFAHGEFYMLGGYTSFFITQVFGIHPIVGLFASILCTFLIGILTERLLLTPLYTNMVERKDEYALLITFALSLFLVNAGIVVFGPYQKTSSPFASGSFSLGFLQISEERLLAAVVALVLLVMMLVVIKKTWLGIALRAISQDREASSIVGIPSSRLGSLAFGIGTALAGASGSLLAPIFMVSPEMGVLPALKSFVIIVLGSMGSIKGALYGSLIIGIAESLGAHFLSVSYRDAYSFIILVLVLLIKPNGMFGGKQQWHN